MKHSGRYSVAAARVVLMAAAAVLVTGPFMRAQPKFSEWSAAVILEAPVNSASDESGPALSRDGLSLYFQSNRPGGLGLADIWVSQRNSVDDSWGHPTNLTMVNSSAEDATPNLSRDGHWLFFASRRDGSLGGFDIWVSYREHIHDDFDWQPPVHLGPEVNSPSFDMSPFFFDNDEVGAPMLFFGRTVQSNDILVSMLLPDGTLTPAVPAAAFNSPSNERGISVRFDGLEAFIMSNRSGGSGLQDLWTATRSSVFDPWSVPVNMGSAVNSAGGDFDPHITSDRETLYFMSNRPGGPGGQDLYVSTRARQKPEKD